MNETKLILSELRTLRAQIHAACEDFKSRLREIERLMLELEKS